MNGDLWNQVLERLRGKVNSHSFNTWFRPTEYLDCSGRSLIVRVPNPLFAEWLRNNYLPLISRTIEDIQGQTWDVHFKAPVTDSRETLPASCVSTPSRPPSRRPLSDSAQPPANGGGVFAARETDFNPRYTFDTFVVGSANQFASAAAKAVSDGPSKSYNPLYIYGGVGLGKTHLMHAIGNWIVASGGRLKLHYVTTEHFMNELIMAIRYEKTIDFRERYRFVDVLLVDDIQFLRGKERTQEEFFHTFNTLYSSRKQIVMTSDCAPRHIPGLEERLRSRFEWGLIADIQPPDLETKIAILKKKADAEGVALSSDVALFIASNVKSNVRELEGWLIRLLAYASIRGRSVDIDLAKQILQDLLPAEPAVVTIEAIQKHVAERYDLKVSQLKSKNNSKSISFPRQVAMYLCKTMTDQSLPEIGKKFGGKHHTTVIHAVRKIEDLRKRDRDLESVLHNLSQALR